MADNLQSGMAQPELLAGMQVVLEALDPTSGAPVAGVVISDVVISGIPTEGASFDDSGPLPTWVPDGDVEVV